MSYSELQNGSDIRGIALENETGEKVNLTDKAAFGSLEDIQYTPNGAHDT